MKYHVLTGRGLTADLVRRWAEIQAANANLASPYFCPEFTEAVAKVRDDVFVGVLEDAGRITGFFPFHRRRGGIGQPIGLGLSDYHGVVAARDAEWAVADLLKGCGLIRYEFDHLLVSQRVFAPYCQTVEDSPILDLAGGYQRFEVTRDKAGRKQLREIDRKRERLEAEAGPLTFISHSSSEDVLRTLMEWKSAQCRETGTIDYFGLPWCRQLIQSIHASRSACFGGILACLYAGDRLAAAHFAMRSGGVWHSWFPVYNHELQAYSPGLILLVEMIRAAEVADVAYIDFGKGISTYKRRFMTGAIPVARGRAELPSLLNGVRRLRDRVEEWSRKSVLRPILRQPGRLIKNMERKKRYG